MDSTASPRTSLSFQYEWKSSCHYSFLHIRHYPLLLVYLRNNAPFDTVGLPIRSVISIMPYYEAISGISGVISVVVMVIVAIGLKICWNKVKAALRIIKAKLTVVKLAFRRSPSTSAERNGASST